MMTIIIIVDDGNEDEMCFCNAAMKRTIHLD